MAKTKLAAQLFAVGTLIVLSFPAYAETGRYTMTPTKDGVLKLDTQTGAVSLCQRSTAGWTCQGVDDNSQSSKNRLQQLEKENADLRAQLNARSFAPAPNENGKLSVPSEEDVDKAMDFMEKLLHRFKGMAESLKKDKKNDEDGVPL